jgi:hypothetical protein
MNYNTLITVTSWEERFELGLKKFLENNSIENVVLFDFINFSDIIKKNVLNICEILDNKGIKSEIISLEHNKNSNNWKIIMRTMKNLSGALIIDISTMPRDIIYYSLYHSINTKKIDNIFCLYNRPEGYSKDNWLTSDPRKPFLIYNMSGIFEMGKDTILIILTGFDKKRVEQLLNYYEPKTVFMGTQSGEQYENFKYNAKQYIELYQSSLNICLFDFDAYNINDYGYSQIEEIIKKNNDANIIAASLGPKPSSIALFRLNLKYPNLGLIHVPVTIYNMNYSFGLNQENIILEQIK